MSEENFSEKKIASSLPITGIFSLASAAVLALLLFNKYGFIAAIGGFILGLIPLVGPAALIYFCFAI